MTMAYIRKTYNVPAKRGMRVMPRTGVRKGMVGYIRAARDGLLEIVDVPQGRYGWWSLYHPDDLDYQLPKPPNTY
jgi:hypothetical protein